MNDRRLSYLLATIIWATNRSGGEGFTPAAAANKANEIIQAVDALRKDRQAAQRNRSRGVKDST